MASMASINDVAKNADSTDTSNTLFTFRNLRETCPKHRSVHYRPYSFSFYVSNHTYWWNNLWAASLILHLSHIQVPDEPDILIARLEKLVETNVLPTMAPTEQSPSQHTDPVEKPTHLHPGPIVPPGSVLADQTGARLILNVTRALFENRNTVPEGTFDRTMALCKKIVKSAEKYEYVR